MRELTSQVCATNSSTWEGTRASQWLLAPAPPPFSNSPPARSLHPKCSLCAHRRKSTTEAKVNSPAEREHLRQNSTECQNPRRKSTARRKSAHPPKVNTPPKSTTPPKVNRKSMPSPKVQTPPKVTPPPVRCARSARYVEYQKNIRAW